MCNQIKDTDATYTTYLKYIKIDLAVHLPHADLAIKHPLT